MWVKLTRGCVSGEDSKKGVRSGSALANRDADALMSGEVGSFHDTEPFAPALMATMVSTRNSAPVGVRDQYLSEHRKRQFNALHSQRGDRM